MLTATSEYALRALAQLAQLPRGKVLLGRDLAEQAGVPPRYLSKIMLALRNAGLVVATRGTGGGYMLLRPADAIRLIDVVQVFEGPSAWPECLLRGKQECTDKNPCAAHASWGKVRRTYLDFLERTTLWEVVHDKAHQSQLTRPARGTAPKQAAAMH
jgi:Rrf2 family protein